MVFRRHPWFAIAALAIYLTANVGVRGLHHHAAQTRTPLSFADSKANSYLKGPAAPPAECDNHPCPICNVLYMGQVLPAIAVSTLICHTGEVVTPAVDSIFHPVASSVYSRAPPAI